MKGFTAGIIASLAASAVAAPATLSKRAGNGRKTVLNPKSNATDQASPTYRALSDFDYESFNLGLYQEWIELDLFHYGLATFSDAEFDEAGIDAGSRSLLQFFANQETGHAQLISDILGAGASKQCTYNYSGAFDDVRSYVDFNQRLTRWGESGVYGFLSKLNSKPSAELLVQSIATEARQQYTFRQWSGGNSINLFFESGIPQAWQWTMLAPYIQSCPAENHRIGFSNYATLKVENNPSLATPETKAAISQNRTALTYAGETINVSWIPAGEKVGPNNSYTTVSPGGSTPKYCNFLQQYNGTFSPFTQTGENSGYCKIPSGNVFNTSLANSGPALNGTGFIALTSDNPHLTPYNYTKILDVMVAGPSIIQFG